MTAGLWFALACSLFAIIYGAVSTKWILALPTGNDRMREIAAAIQAGAMAYLNRQYTTIGIVGAILFLVVGLVPGLGWATAWGFLLGDVMCVV
jgi:K(+)-stimulated pyrophosphate-energized sodium pump